ncbi:polysaccharide deacetylase family protein [Eubacterium oxidoreducens]|uniref:Peptidoglycan/xylan/chitin deacetylase, PgdA/CDA1 family n=1 Tax=Eubacterium oxidoreducens TaxID=1732 RepID=A0A1G6C0H1_EUBOX|nr:polysaccharide deacetylase family protein [Eubacterium oxidoreducens]SDB26362.1 Peptidoglycan/xylan/chitin deacetylase, PgdA/CDA1 family [Eubacterium oxidoreducens]
MKLVRSLLLGGKIRFLLMGIFFAFLLLFTMNFHVAADIVEEESITATAKYTASTGVTISFSASSSDNCYSIKRSYSKNGDYLEIQKLTSLEGDVSYIDKSISEGNIYYYRIDQIIDDTIAVSSEPICVKIVLSAPTSVKTQIKSTKKVKISWKAVTGADQYVVYKSTSKSGTYKKLKTTTKTSCIDKSTTAGKAFYYKVVAKKTSASWAKSAYSKVAAAYQKPAATTVSASSRNSKIYLSWTKVSGAQKYFIYRKVAGSKYKLIKKSKKLSYTDKHVDVGKIYKYKVIAIYKADGKKIKSDSSNITKLRCNKIDPNGKMIALTFDDGPGPYTNAILNCLKKYDARATFFVVGSNAKNYKSILKKADSIGCEIGNHTYSHPYLSHLSAAGVKAQMSKTDSIVKSATGHKTTLMRTPYGAFNSTVKSSVGKPIILWSVDTLDWKTRSTSQTLNCVMNNAKDGDIILMHDIHKPTKDAVLLMVPRLVKKGYQLVTVSELAQYRGYNLKKGNVYHSLR